jgi:hypothetical protein
LEGDLVAEAFELFDEPSAIAFGVLVADLHHVNAKTACAVSKASNSRTRVTRCVGKPFTSGAYPVLVIRSFRGWKLLLTDHNLVIRFTKGRASFLGEGQDVPPYPC